MSNLVYYMPGVILMNKKYIIIFCGIVIIAVCLFIFHDHFLNNEETTVNNSGPIYEQDIKPQIFAKDTVKATLYLPKSDLSGYETKEVEYAGQGLEVQKRLINDLLFNYLKDKIEIPEDTVVLDLEIWNETLKVNFNKAATGIKVNDPRMERYIIGSIVNSLLTTSKKFTDVQFLVEGERVDAFFGHINTRNPFMFMSE